MTAKSTEEALAALMASTRRVRRKLNLLEVASWLDIAVKGLGSFEAVSEAIGVSTEMLRQFSCTRKLAPQVKGLIARRLIDGVDIAYRLSKLTPVEQCHVAAKVAKGELHSADVRAIVAFRLSNPKAAINGIIRKVLGSRVIKEYEARFVVPTPELSQDDLRRRFAKLLGESNIRALDIKGHGGTLVVSAEGKDRLQEAARQRKVTKRMLIDDLISGGAS